MKTKQSSRLLQKRCVPCEGGLPPLSSAEVKKLLKEVPGWTVSDDGKSIERQWRLQNFTKCLEFINKVGEVAEQEGHHPDLHLTRYRNVTIALTTHAINGLSENDFILAAKIDEIAPQTI